MEERDGGTASESVDVAVAREKVQGALQELEQECPKKFRWRPWARLRQDTEKALGAKVLGRIDDRLFWLEKRGGPFNTSPEPTPSSVAAEELKSLLSSVVTAVGSSPLNESLLWSLERNLRNVYDQVAPDAHVSVEIKNEVANADQGSADYFEDLRDVTSAYADHPPEKLPSRDLLVLRKQALDHHYRHERAKAARRRELLWLSSLLLWLLVPTLAVVTAALQIEDIDFGWWEVAAALILGGFGGSLSGMRKLRDGLERLAQMDSFRAAVWAQLAAAAGLGLLALILFRAGVLPQIGERSAWDGLVYAFLAGFSEPFAIQAVMRLAGRS